MRLSTACAAFLALGTTVTAQSAITGFMISEETAQENNWTFAGTPIGDVSVSLKTWNEKNYQLIW